jgi:hypothetical protein
VKIASKSVILAVPVVSKFFPFTTKSTLKIGDVNFGVNELTTGPSAP